MKKEAHVILKCVCGGKKRTNKCCRPQEQCQRQDADQGANLLERQKDTAAGMKTGETRTGRLLAQTEIQRRADPAQLTSTCASKSRRTFVKMSDTVSDLDTQEACAHTCNVSKTLISHDYKVLAEKLKICH